MNAALARPIFRALALAVACCALAHPSAAQDRCLDPAVPKQALRDFGQYAVAIAKSPAKLRHLTGRDAVYLLAFSGATAALIATDSSVSNSIDSAHEDRRESNYASNLMVAAALSTSTIKYLVGCHEHNRQRRDDAVREWESMGFALGSVGALKYIFRRQRPGPGSNGDFFAGGTSFPSGHAAVSTAWAATLGEEYPGHAWEYLALGGAGTVSAFRITAKKHFPSDTLVGGMIGFLTGSYICRHGKCRETPPKAEIEPGTPGRPQVAVPSPFFLEHDTTMAAARRQFCDSISDNKEEAEKCGEPALQGWERSESLR
jgi:membrane-associated phospholipid phosphatase